MVNERRNSAAKPRFGGGNMKNHESNRGKVGSQLVENSAGTHRDVSQCFPSSDLASLDKVHRWRPCPPAYTMERPRNAVPFGTGVDTHTHTHTVTLGGARVEGLNRYLKSLRNKRKKHRKSSAKRAREKDRSREMKK